MRVLRGSLISQRDPQNKDEIGDPGSPISWGPQNFMTPGLATPLVSDCQYVKEHMGLHSTCTTLIGASGRGLIRPTPIVC